VNKILINVKYKEMQMTEKCVFLFQEMEDLVAEKVVEMISSRSELGELRQKCNAYQVKNALSKTC
jgi:hypothetical protein